MEQYIITTDNNSDLPADYYEKNQVGCCYLSYQMDGKSYGYPNFLPDHEFYERMRNGSMPTTAQVNPEMAKNMMEPYLKQGKDILHIAFSSGLSGTYQSCCTAASELLEEYPERKIAVVDSLSASLGQGYLIDQAVRRKAEGMSMPELVKWLEENRLHVVHAFTVNDLFHLYRGGRVSRATAVVGSMLNIKPVLHVDDQGKLVSVGKARGRRKSLSMLVEMMNERIGAYRETCDTIFISHGDCLEDARYVEQKVKQIYGIKTVLINHVGATIGAHSGPGTVALFFMGEYR